MKWYGIDESVLCQYMHSDTATPITRSGNQSMVKIKDTDLTNLGAVPELKQGLICGSILADLQGTENKSQDTAPPISVCDLECYEEVKF